VNDVTYSQSYVTLPVILEPTFVLNKSEVIILKFKNFSSYSVLVTQKKIS